MSHIFLQAKYFNQFIINFYQGKCRMKISMSCFNFNDFNQCLNNQIPRQNLLNNNKSTIVPFLPVRLEQNSIHEKTLIYNSEIIYCYDICIKKKIYSLRIRL